MCGFTGFFQGSIFNSGDQTQESLKKMTDAIIHRGPDAEGFWFDQCEKVAFAHRRLAILELSEMGHQPMFSHSKRYVVVFNGEIYNHLQLRSKLEQEKHVFQWRGHSDTETLLACFTTWGVEKTLQLIVGMFSIVLWDKWEKKLILARDRLGEKPLYWGWCGQTLLFGSELKALKAHPDFVSEINRDALALLLQYNYIPAPYSIYKNIEKLPAGSYVQIQANDTRHTVEIKKYWNLKAVMQNGLDQPFQGDALEAANLLEQKLVQSISEQMLADVPLGAFLSGGVDSSTVVALMQSQSAKPIKTFAIGFNERGYNEAEFAKEVARHLGTEHTELYVTAEDALSVIAKLPKVYCEPFADSSQIPTFLVMQMAKQHVTVALSGDAGDELFGGYNTYQMAAKVWNSVSKLPYPLRKIATQILGKIPTSQKIQKLLYVLPAQNREEFYQFLVTHWKTPNNVVKGAQTVGTVFNTPNRWVKTDHFEQWMMAIDTNQYMVDDILVKVDRAAMANSLETRVPMLDHRVVEFAWQLPLDYKIKNGIGKNILRDVLYKHVPRELIERPKKGFSIPLAQWLRGPLREWAENLLSEQRLQAEDYFYVEPIRKIWQEHLSGKQDHATRLWSILMFQAWLDEQNS
ncbi:asparagine synthase (glutamine-hydrolyzing) [Acinetobacter indicus]|uniref:asparagine synthase (glutamine-hydrolyzing) n=1 Tax=Acinetobacter indicus TaxID=756892 RepID=A0A7S7AEL0_9GAMM|nr:MULTISPECIES: asparagine synthase (glutamine-hydrolyzing) [Acinetobacter]QOW42831.1 asparagine synthase (glutamine-hydrolyzing) [Acinetobacter indicus]